MDFLVFPDHPVTDRLAARLPRTSATRTIAHLSGRPWIVGHWRREELVTARVGPRCAVLLGTTSATSDALARLLPRLRGLDDLAELRHELPGSYFLLACMGAEVRAQGSLSAVRRLHRTDLGGLTVLGSRPRTWPRWPTRRPPPDCPARPAPARSTRRRSPPVCSRPAPRYPRTAHLLARGARRTARPLRRARPGRPVPRGPLVAPAGAGPPASGSRRGGTGGPQCGRARPDPPGHAQRRPLRLPGLHQPVFPGRP
ncbi:hypothetical protein O1L44_21345 [Streptomyces noursei]|nr:hypothetical protein [Streptomyces noursei]